MNLFRFTTGILVMISGLLLINGSISIPISSSFGLFISLSSLVLGMGNVVGGMFRINFSFAQERRT